VLFLDESQTGFSMRNALSSRRFALVLSAALGVTTGPVAAHEFWIDPVSYTPAVGATVPIVFRIGSDFHGDTFPYIRAFDQHFSVTDAGGKSKPETLDGDDPAAEVKFTTKGLTIVAHQRGQEEVVFKTMAAFEENLREEGLEPLIEAHKKANKPATDIRELYTRYAKALVQVGGGTGSDKALGLPYELVAETDPYIHPKGQPFAVRFLKGGQPIAGALVKCFQRDKPDSTAPKPQEVRTDANGRAACDISKSGEHMISTVAMISGTPADKADWISHWATLSFARP
jgi:Domain of unknown function (DUF4198)